MFAEIPNRFKEVIVIGKIMILKFSDKEKQIMEQVRSIIKNETNVEYTEVMPKSVLYFKDLKIQLKEQEVYRKDKRIPLSHQEFLALRLLTEHPGWICTKEQIYDAVYDGKFKEKYQSKKITCSLYSSNVLGSPYFPGHFTIFMGREYPQIPSRIC
jgi:hypothetical protein